MRLKMKRIFTFSAALLFAFLSVAGGSFFSRGSKTASAETAPPVNTRLNIAGGEFGGASSGFPYTPSDWTGELLLGGSALLHTGIISMSPGVYLNNDVLKGYHLNDKAVPRNPFSEPLMFTTASKEDPDFLALMINTSESNAAYAYTSGDIALDAYKSYEISAWVQTFAFEQGGASIKLIDSSSGLSIGRKADSDTNTTEKLMAFRNIDTTTLSGGTMGWHEYKFNIQTAASALTVKVSLSVGDSPAEKGKITKGVAFFDHVTGKSISRESYIESLNREGEFSHSFSFETDAPERGVIDETNVSYIYNGRFDKGANISDLSGWTPIVGGHGIVDPARPLSPGTPAIAPLSDNDAQLLFDNKTGDFDGTSLRIQNLDAASASGVQSAAFTLNRYRNYRISVWYLTIDGATVSLALTAAETDTDVLPKATRKTLGTITALSSAENHDTFNWQQASIVVKGSTVSDHVVNLELWNGYGERSSTTLSKGVAFFDRVQIQYIDSAEYTSLSASGTPVVLDTFVADSAITNGFFNEVSYKDFDDFEVNGGSSSVARPLAPEGWTFVNGEETNYNPGAIEFDYNDNAIVRGVVAGNSSSGCNNVLKIQNLLPTAGGYVSSSLTIGSGAYQKVSVMVNTGTEPQVKAFLQLASQGRQIAAIENINTGGQWVTYSFIVAAGSDAPALNLILWNGWRSIKAYEPRANLSAGTIFFAKADSNTSSEADYDNYVDGTDKTVKTVDLKSNFGLFDNTKGTFKESYNFVGTGDKNAVMAGVVDTKNFIASEMSPVANPGTSVSTNRYVLMVKNSIRTAYKMTSYRTGSLSANSYHKVTISLRTANIEGDEGGKGYGAYINLLGVKNATMSGLISNNKYTTYTFYIATGDESLTFYYELGLGDTSRPATITKGVVFFEDMSVTPIDRLIFENAGNENAVRLSLATKAASDGEKDLSKSFWDWYWLPTVIFSLAILFTLIMLSIRNIFPAVSRAFRRRKRTKAVRVADDKTYTVEEDNGYSDISDDTPKAKREKKAKVKTSKQDDGETDSSGAYNDYFED